MTTKKRKTPIFTDDEYTDFDARPDLDAAWDRLPVVRRLAGLKLRWVGPLVELGLDTWLSDLSDGGWGYLEDSGWSSLLPTGPMLDKHGRVRAVWSRAFKAAVERLAEAGERCGPESDRDRWASWLVFELAAPRQLIREQAERQGWDR